MSNCRGCGIELIDDNWTPSRKKNNNHICKKCVSKFNKEYRNTEAGKISAIKSNSKRIGKRKEYCKHWRNKNSNYVVKYNKKYKSSNKIILNKKRQEYFKTFNGQIHLFKWNSVRRNRGFIPLNTPEVDGWVGHHLDNDYVIFIPEELHKSICHSVIKDKNMDIINDKVYEWFIKYYFRGD